MTKKYVVEIVLGNDDMSDFLDVANALIILAETISEQADLSKSRISDINGNAVGFGEIR